MDTPGFMPEFMEKALNTFARAVLMHRPGKIKSWSGKSELPRRLDLRCLPRRSRCAIP